MQKSTTSSDRRSLIPASSGYTNEYKVLFVSCDSWNYTFYSSGSIGTILLLNLITNYTYDKSFFMWTFAFQYTSLIGIICISYKYFDTYITNFQRLSSQPKNTFGC